MSDEHNRPVFEPDPAPDHGPAFWTGLGSAMNEPADTVVALDAVSEPDRPARLRPLLAAAALVVVVGLGALLVRSLDSGDSTDLVAGEPTENALVPLDGPDGSGSDDPDSSAAPEPTPTPTSSPVTADVRPITPAPSVQGPPEFARAWGNTATSIFAPITGQLPDEARFLASWNERRVSWFSVPGTDCNDLTFSQIYYVNDAGGALPIHEPQLHFSGSIDYFTVQPESGRAAWLVSCGTQLELHVGLLAGSGDISSSQMVWVGEGVVPDALMLWDGSVVSFNAISPDGQPFFVDYDIMTNQILGTGVAVDESEPGRPTGVASVLVGATADASFTYWNAAGSDVFAPCDATSSTLWVRADVGDQPLWTRALGEVDAGVIMAFALDDRFAQVAFADTCEGRDGRVFIGTRRADGEITNVQELDLSPYVGGFADELYWIDDTTLRIETDNRALGVNRFSFDYLIDEGIVVQLN